MSNVSSSSFKVEVMITFLKEMRKISNIDQMIISIKKIGDTI